MFLCGFFCLCLLGYSSDFSEYPRHRCSSIREVSNRIGFPIAMPDFLADLDASQYRVKYYSTSTQTEKDIIKDGYFILVKSLGAQERLCKKMEFRGTDLKKAGATSENLSAELYTCTIAETPIENWSDKKLVYSAYNPVYRSKKQELPYFETFFVYCMDGSIRYSITFSDFLSQPSKQTAEACIEQAKAYFSRYIR